MKKKKKRSRPQKQTLKRPQRLLRAKAWLESYTGNQVVRAYRKRYGTDLLSSIAELRMLGVTITPEYEEAVKATVVSLLAQKEQIKEVMQQEFEDMNDDQDENFAFIAGYTSGGAPYGIRWEDMDDPGLDKEY